jgi:diguanylate cyclase (GGDEF)-like protein
LTVSHPCKNGVNPALSPIAIVMPLQLPRLCAAFADVVVGIESLEEAYASLRSVVGQHLQAESVVFVRKNDRWVRLAGRVTPERERIWRASIDRFSDASPSVFRIDDPVGGPATAIIIADDERIALVVEGDWISSAEVLDVCASTLRVGLRALRERRAHRRAERLLRRIYRLTKRVGTAGGDALVERIVAEVAMIFSADRVSIALYDHKDDRLKIKAARGLAKSVAHDVRIRPGDWIIGRVFGSGKAVIVNDVRSLPSPSHHDRYRSQAFAVVPLPHRDQIIGVLSITDCRDGSSFGVPEQFVLNSIASVIGASLAGERTDAEIARLEHAASVDSLTGLLNRAYLDSRLQQEVARSQRQGTGFAVLMADIDDFKVINDTRGHQSGDAMLKGVGDIMRSAVRVFDVCARWGGDEFAVLMPNSDHASAMAVAERIRLRTAQYLGDREGGALGITISIGVAVGGAGDTSQDVIARADRALYDAKTNGKDTVRVSDGRPAAAGDMIVGTKLPVEIARPLEKVTRRLSYVLVADPSQDRAAVYRAAANQSRLGLLVARSGEQAARVMEQFGPPVLLAVDMTAAEMQGVSLIEAAESTQLPMLVVAFSSSRAFREYSASRHERLRLDVIRPDAPAEAVRAVIERALREQPPLSASTSEAEATSTSVSTSAREHAAPAAVYFNDARETEVRATVTWHTETVVAQADIPDMNGAARAFVDGPLPIEQDAPTQIDQHAHDAFPWGADGEIHAALPDPPPQSAADSNVDELASAGEWQPTLLERKRGEFEVARELARTRREQRQLSVVLFDVSERANDQASAERQVKDELLHGVAETLVKAIRQSDLPIHWSGNELLLVLPGLAGTEARAVAERVRAAMQAGGQHRVAIAGGVAQLDTDEQFGSVVRRARAKLAEALARGHNRVS